MPLVIHHIDVRIGVVIAVAVVAPSPETDAVPGGLESVAVARVAAASKHNESRETPAVDLYPRHERVSCGLMKIVLRVLQFHMCRPCGGKGHGVSSDLCIVGEGCSTLQDPVVIARQGHVPSGAAVPFLEIVIQTVRLEPPGPIRGRYRGRWRFYLSLCFLVLFNRQWRNTYVKCTYQDHGKNTKRNSFSKITSEQH